MSTYTRNIGVDFLNKASEYRVMPTVALRGLVVFPGMGVTFDVGRARSLQAIKAAMADDQQIFLVAQKDVRDDEPDIDKLYKIGTIAKVSHILRLPNSDTVRVSVDGITRATMVDMLQCDPYLITDVRIRREISVKSDDKDYATALVRQTKDYFEDYAEVVPQMPAEIILDVLEKTDPGELADYIGSNIMIEYKKRQQILNEMNPLKRLEKVCCLLASEGDLMKLENEINQKVQENIDKSQREYYLHEQMKIISDELNDGLSPQAECDELREKILALGLEEKAEKKLLKECARLEKMSPTSPEATVNRVYLETCLELPWHKYSVDKLDLTHARKVLDHDHYGLEKVKERIIEALAVRSLSEGSYGQTLCLVGPPGVGKTSVAKSVASAMGRSFARISLGGTSDEAEIRGHRKTYIGAMPGRIVNAIKQAGTQNPIILLDEIDKLGSDYKGDPSSALLEVLDGEQNSTFVDRYIEIEFDLSKVMFITTANDVSTIPSPLLDRMEVIELSGYTRNEKAEIAKRYLVPKEIEKNGLDSKKIEFMESGVYRLIDGFTREAGVRNLEREIGGVCRKAATSFAEGKRKRKYVIDADEVGALLGADRFSYTDELRNDEVGCATGLAWTQVGGTTLPVEVALYKGKGNLVLTGKLGDVMQESAKIALTYVKMHSTELGIDEKEFENNDVHIHVPEGATPKDGPSAGVTLTTAIASAFTGRKVRGDIAMTGEVTLRGKVLPIGGLKEKSLAAYRLGVRNVIIPDKNEKDLEEIPSNIRKEMKFVPVSDLREVLSTALR